MEVYFATFSFMNSQGCIKLQLTMDCHSAEQLIQEFGFWILFGSTIPWTASTAEHGGIIHALWLHEVPGVSKTPIDDGLPFGRTGDLSIWTLSPVWLYQPLDCLCCRTWGCISLPSASWSPRGVKTPINNGLPFGRTDNLSIWTLGPVWLYQPLDCQSCRTWGCIFHIHEVPGVYKVILPLLA